VAGGRADKVFVMDANTLEVLKAIPVGKRVWGLAMSRDGMRIYTTDGTSSTVSVIDTGDNSVVATIPVGEMPWGVVIDD
jgi:YVTN family beta-propeller protein